MDSCSGGPAVAGRAVEWAADALNLMAVAHHAHHAIECGDMVRGFTVDVDGLTGDQAGDFQAKMHGCLCVDSFSIGHKKAPRRELVTVQPPNISSNKV